MLKVKGLIEREQVRIGDIISYPEGKIATVAQTKMNYGCFGIVKNELGHFQTVSYAGKSLTYYGNIYEMAAQSRQDYESMENFKRMKISGGCRLNDESNPFSPDYVDPQNPFKPRSED
jgi:hypothetical protein